MSYESMTEVKNGKRVITRHGIGTIIAKEVYYGKPRFGVKHDQENDWTRLSPGQTPFYWPNELTYMDKELPEDTVEFQVFSHNDSQGRCHFSIRWFDPEYHLGPITRGQHFFGKISEWIKPYEQNGKKIIHAKPDYS